MESIIIILKELDKIALKSKELINEEFLELLIEDEKYERKIGYLNRIEEFKKKLFQIKIINNLNKYGNIKQLFQKYNSIIDELMNRRPNKFKNI